MLQIYHFLDSFLVFLEHFQLKRVSLFILDQYLIAFFIFQFQKVPSYFTNNERSVIVCLKIPALFVSLFLIFFVFDKDKNPFSVVN